MDLKELRNQIDIIDQEILEKFQQRMELCLQVAEYKKKNHVEILQSGREKEVIDGIRHKAEPRYADSAAVLFSNIMDISKSYQQCEINDGKKYIGYESLYTTNLSKLGCYGGVGSNSEEAAKRMFGPDRKLTYYREFEDVFKAVDSGELDFGVVPVQNSSTGSISQTYDLMKKYNVYITQMTRVSIKHCLAANTDDIDEIKSVYSHPQALMQCSEYLEKNGFKPVHYGSTAAAARYAARSSKKVAAVCSEKCAVMFGLHVLEKNISDVESNYTRFICISKKCRIDDSANRISVLMSLSNEEGSLYRILTKFRVAGLNLLKIESRPLNRGDFGVTFYLDFEGNIIDKKVSSLLTELSIELSDFRFLGNYREYARKN